MSTPQLTPELKILQQYSNDIQQLADNLAEASPDDAKRLQRELDRKLEIYRKQIELVKANFPNAPEGRVHEAGYYTFMAMGKFHSVGFMRRAAANRENNMAVGVASAMIAKHQEKGNAREALGLLDRALEIYDYPGAHFAKAMIFETLKEHERAIREANYVITNFQDDDVYVLARQLKDEIENPVKKGMCFIATAAYGSPVAQQVQTLCEFRDDTLLKYRIGNIAVRFYYYISPPLAGFIGRHSRLRAFVRTGFLEPILFLLKQMRKSNK